jgi:hypothetical protein
MSETLQFEHHPDADQISAFVEQALPAHEREQMLGHLAACAECRAIVALSLPEVEEPVQPLPAATQKRWWPGWTPAWTFAGALGALAFLVVYIHHSKIAPSAPEQQVAVAPLAEPPVSVEQAPKAAAKQALRGTQMPPTGGQAARAGLATPAPKQENEALRAGQALGGPILKNRNFAALGGVVQPPPPVLAENPIRNQALAAAPSPGSSSGAMGGVAGASSIAAEARSQPAAATQPGATAGPPAQAAKASPLATPAASQTVEATRTAQMQAIPANTGPAGVTLDEIQLAPFIQLKHPLPSRLMVLSMAAQARRMVAIDTSHAVFVSTDAGGHWKVIHAPWQGQAVKASLVEHGGGTGAPSSLLLGGVVAGASSANDAVLSRPKDGDLNAQPPQPSAKGPSLSGTVTDMTGAAISGASVTVAETTTGAARTVKTDGAGRYLVDGLAPGTYRVGARSPGFNSQELAAIVVPSAGLSVANLSLTVGAATQAVTVQADKLETDAPANKPAKAAASGQTVPIFEITTDKGERWRSIDGMTWKPM